MKVESLESLESLEVAVYRVPTEAPESDGTLTWDATTVVVVEPTAGGRRGLGFSYATSACAPLIREVLAPAVVGRDALDVPGAWSAMVGAIGDGAEVMVDANGAYTAKQAVRLARSFAAEGVCWFEEPVSSDDLDGLRTVRELVDLDVAAGEYGYDLAYFERMAAAASVDVVQADVSRCAGVTEWLRVGAVAAAHGLELSAHCAQSLHLHPACAVANLRHLEYFADHGRVDRLLFDGVADPVGGWLRPDLDRPGIGLELKRADAEPYRCRP